MSGIPIQDQIQSAQDQYYQEHAKHHFFKKSQKMECATKVVDQVGLNNLIEKTIYYEPGTNVLVLNYPVFKTFATNDICEEFTKYFIEMLEYGKTYYNNVELRINLDTLSITAIERYKSFIEMSMEILSEKYDDVIDACILYNAPSFTGQIINVFAGIVGKSRFNTLQTKLTVISKK